MKSRKVDDEFCRTQQSAAHLPHGAPLGRLRRLASSPDFTSKRSTNGTPYTEKVLQVGYTVLEDSQSSAQALWNKRNPDCFRAGSAAQSSQMCCLPSCWTLLQVGSQQPAETQTGNQLETKPCKRFPEVLKFCKVDNEFCRLQASATKTLQAAGRGVLERADTWLLTEHT